ncbi:alpha and gamma adaptin binding protein p34-domain-containing protein [Aspergillus californicus]
MPTTKPKNEIPNPRRLLILSPSSHSIPLIPSLLKTLTDHAVAESQLQSGSFAGYTTHQPLCIENRYYSAEVPVWVDEVPFTDGLPVSTKEVGVDSKTGMETETPSKPEEAQENGTGTGTAPETSSAQWAREFSSAEAQVVRDAIGAVLITIQNPSPSLALNPDGQNASAAGTVEDRADVQALKTFIKAIGGVRALIEEERGEIGSVPGLLVLGRSGKGEQTIKKGEGRGNPDLDFKGSVDGYGGDGLDDPFSIGWWEDQLCEMGLIGFEVVEWEWDGSGSEMEEKRNQYGELQGMRRIKEVLETHDWAGGEDEDEEPDTTGHDDDDLERELLGLDKDGGGFGLEVNELEREMVGLRFAIDGGNENSDEENEGDEEIRVDAVEALLTRMRAIKDMSDELPEKDRKRFAAKAVKDIMKEI